MIVSKKLKTHIFVDYHDYENIRYKLILFNPLTPCDAFKHHFASLKNELFSYTKGF